jgi:hypothetical protein
MNMPRKRWLLHGTASLKVLATQKAVEAMKRKPTSRSGYKIKKRGDYWDVYILTTEKPLFER